MKILSIQVGQPQILNFRGREITTSIFKSPVQGPLMVRTLNIDGDRQADLTVHGGIDKAVYAYSFDAYSWWKMKRPSDTFNYGAFGENLLIDRINENETFIGDTFEVGEAILQVAQPRMPCYKLAVKFEDPSILRTFMESKRPGIYFRVLKEGLINVEQEFKLINREKIQLSVSQLFGFTQGEKIDPKMVKEYLKIKTLPEEWREQLKSVED